MTRASTRLTIRLKATTRAIDTTSTPCTAGTSPDWAESLANRPKPWRPKIHSVTTDAPTSEGNFRPSVASAGPRPLRSTCPKKIRRGLSPRTTAPVT